MHDSNRREKSCFEQSYVFDFSGEMTTFKADDDGLKEKYHHVFSEKAVIGGGNIFFVKSSYPKIQQYNLNQRAPRDFKFS